MSFFLFLLEIDDDDLDEMRNTKKKIEKIDK